MFGPQDPHHPHPHHPHHPHHHLQPRVPMATGMKEEPLSHQLGSVRNWMQTQITPPVITPQDIAK